MKKEPNNVCSICHEMIRTKPVFSENNKVYQKKDCAGKSMADDEWSPLNFHWMPVLKLKEILINQ